MLISVSRFYRRRKDEYNWEVGINPLPLYDINDWDIEYFYQTEDVEELEQQRNEMLEALIDVYQDYTLHNTERIKTLIEKADPLHRSWEEIKELLWLSSKFL